MFDVVRQAFPTIAVTDLQDDAVVLPSGQVISTDTLVDERHFSRTYCAPFDIGMKAARVSLSDIGACGAQPTGLLVSLALPKTISTAWVEGFYAGLKQALDDSNCAMLGGDTVASESLVITTTALGQVAQGSMAGRRFNAQPGQAIYMCGAHGLSAVGLVVLKHAVNGFLQARQAHRQAATLHAQGCKLAALVNSPYALTDTSDGLAAAVMAIAQASGVGCVVQANQIPIEDDVTEFAMDYANALPPAWQQHPAGAALATTLFGGEDFGLVATVPNHIPLPAPWVTIGSVTTGSGVLLALANGQHVPLTPESLYQHF